MSDGMENYSAAGQWSKIIAGFKGGPFNMTPQTAPPMKFVSGYDAKDLEKIGHRGVPSIPIIDTWPVRHASK